jgi:hypothetical protein
VFEEWLAAPLGQHEGGSEFSFEHASAEGPSLSGDPTASLPSVPEAPYQVEEDILLSSAEVDAVLAPSLEVPSIVGSAGSAAAIAASTASSVAAAAASASATTRILEMERTMRTYVARCEQSERSVALLSRTVDDLRKAQVAERSTALMDRIRILELEGGNLRADFRRVQLSMYDPAGEFNLIHEQFGALRAATRVGSGVERHGISFSHPGDIASLLRAVSGAVGIFHDAVSLLHSIGSSSSSHKSTLAEMKAQRDVKIATDLEARVITSFRTNLPAILYGGAATVDSIEEFVTLIYKLKNHGMWRNDDGVSGVSQRMLRGAVEIQRRVGFLANQLTTDPAILRLSLGLCSDSVNFIQRMVGFIDGIHMEYKASAFFSEVRLWELCVSYLEQIFEDLRAARCLIQDASENDTSILLWGILKSHEVMDDYLCHDFRKHPSLS